MPRNFPRHGLRLHLTPESLHAVVFPRGGRSWPLAATSWPANSAPDTVSAWLKARNIPSVTAHITLGSALCRFLVLPASTEYLPVSDQTALARHRLLKLIQADTAADWGLWLEERRFRHAQLAVAYPARAIAAWRAWGRYPASCRIQPLLTLVTDALSDALDTHTLILEEGARAMVWQRRQDNFSVQWRPASPIPETTPDRTIRLSGHPLPDGWRPHGARLSETLDTAVYWPCFWGMSPP